MIDFADFATRPVPRSFAELEEAFFELAGDARLIVEVDGYRYHRSPTAFEEDRERDVILAVAGWQTLRFTWAKITKRPEWVAAAVPPGGGRPGVADPTLAWGLPRWLLARSARRLGAWP